MRGKLLRFASMVMVTVGLVATVLGSRPSVAAPMQREDAAPMLRQWVAAPMQQDGGWCDPYGRTCSVDDSGQLTCVLSGQCETEGDVEEGSRICKPGILSSVVTCEENGRRQCDYKCREDGSGWQKLGCATREGVECRHNIWCYWDLEASEWNCWEIPSNETPCEDMDWGTAGIQCLGRYSLNVSVAVPCQRVQRIPYPRGMVVVPNWLWITADSPAWNEAWSETLDYNACLSHDISDGGRAVRNFRIGLAWGRMATPPVWKIENSHLGTYQGWVVPNVVWEQASWGKPRCGPSLTPGEHLPSYHADVYTYWTAYWRVVYERQKMVSVCKFVQAEQDADHCECIPEWASGDSTCDQVDENGKRKFAGYVIRDELCADISNDGCWETNDTGWQAFDLRQFGYPTSYFISRAAGPAPTTLEPNPGCNGICIPVIEVQGIISNPRGH